MPETINFKPPADIFFQNWPFDSTPRNQEKQFIALILKALLLILQIIIISGFIQRFLMATKKRKSRSRYIGNYFKLRKYYETETLDFVDANEYVVHHEWL
jgi:hypothetical protein